MKKNVHLSKIRSVILTAAAAAALLPAVTGCVPFIVKTPTEETATPDTAHIESPDSPDKPDTVSKSVSSSEKEEAASSVKKTSGTSSAEAKKKADTDTSSAAAKVTSRAQPSTASRAANKTESKAVSVSESSAVSSEESKSEQTEPTSVTITLPTTTLNVGQKVTPTVTPEPYDAQINSIEFSASDSTLLAVNGDGTATALDEGECTLTVTVNGSERLTASVNITIEPAPDTEDHFADGILIVNKTYSMSREYDPGGLTPECAAAFERLVSAAADAGYGLYSNSDYRSFDEQEELYNEYVSLYGQDGADQLCSKPGHSEHQTGLAIDVASVSTGYFPGSAEAAWLDAHCPEYGFIIRYPYGKEYYTGYGYEPWHIRYVGEKAQEITDSGLSLEEYYGLTSAYD